MPKSTLLLLTFSVLSVQTYAQIYAFDALRFGQTDGLLPATARMQAVGGGHVSLGGDLSAGTFNPAGLGFYNRSSGSFSLGVNFQNSSDTYLGNTSENFNNAFSINQAAVAIHLPNDNSESTGFIGSALSLGFSRVNDFNRSYRYEGRNNQSSVVDLFLEQATDLNTDNLNALAFAAYDQFLIDFFDASTGTDFFIDDVERLIIPNTGDGTIEGYSSLFGGASNFYPEQSEIIDESGNQYRFNISWGGNFQDKLYFGAGLGIETIYYNRNRNFEESAFEGPGGAPDLLLNKLNLSDNLVTRGGGVNFTAGGIYRPLAFLTLGVTYQSPTYLTLDEESTFDLSADWNNYDYIDNFNSADTFALDAIEPFRSAITETQYRVRTPGKWSLGTTAFINKNGFVTADLELVNYAQTQIRSDNFSPNQENDFINNAFRSVTNVRLGAEYRIQSIFLRAGYAYYQDPLDNNRDRDYITFGTGYRNQEFYLDFAVIKSAFEEQYAPYSLANGLTPVVNSDIDNTQVRVTTGFNF